MSSNHILRSSKRKRTEEAPSTATDKFGIIHNTDLWFQDGNVVLVAQDRIAFRVHSGILSRHSEVFLGMFQIPQAEKNEVEKIDGCSVVHVSDSPEELECVLCAIYDGGQQYFGSNVSLSFPVVSAMLRLGSKYQLESICKEAIRRLRLCFPPSVDDFDISIFSTPGNTSEDPSTDLPPHRPIILRLEDCVAVINLARMFDLTFLLPPAFLCCAQLPLDVIMHGKACDKLLPDDLYACLKGRDALRNHDLRAKGFLFLRQRSTSCETAGECIFAMMRAIEQLYNDRNLAVLFLLSPLDDELFQATFPSGLCIPCRTHVKERHETARREIWDSLGECFGVHPWPPVE